MSDGAYPPRWTAAPSQELLIAARLGVGVGTVQRIGRDATSDIRHSAKRS